MAVLETDKENLQQRLDRETALLAHCNENLAEVKEQCSDLIKERDATVAEAATRAEEEFGGWKALKKELANEIERKFVFTSFWLIK